MKKILLALMLLAASAANATTYVCFSVTAKSGSDVIPSASVLVQTKYPSVSTADIFTDSTGGTPKANPFTGGTDGVQTFCAVPGTYTVTSTKAGYTTSVIEITKGPPAPSGGGGGGIAGPGGESNDRSIPTWNGGNGDALNDGNVTIDVNGSITIPLEESFKWSNAGLSHSDNWDEGYISVDANTPQDSLGSLYLHSVWFDWSSEGSPKLQPHNGELVLLGNDGSYSSTGLLSGYITVPLTQGFRWTGDSATAIGAVASQITSPSAGVFSFDSSVAGNGQGVISAGSLIRPNLTPTADAQAGVGFSFRADDGVAGTTNPGGAYGGAFQLIGGDAKRLTSGNGNGGGVALIGGAGIGVGHTGQVMIGPGTATYPSLGFGSGEGNSFQFSSNTGLYLDAGTGDLGVNAASGMVVQALSGNFAVTASGEFDATAQSIYLSSSGNADFSSGNDLSLHATENLILYPEGEVQINGPVRMLTKGHVGVCSVDFVGFKVATDGSLCWCNGVVWTPIPLAGTCDVS